MLYKLGMKRALPALAAFALLPALVSGCGTSGSDVADIGGKVKISQDSFDRWVTTTAALGDPGAKADARPDGPDYKNCIARQKKNASSKVSEQTLKQLCAAQDKALKQQVLQQLVTQGWVIAQAEAQKLKPDQKLVDAQVKELRRQYPEISGGVNQEDLTTLAESNVLQQQIRQEASKGNKDKPSATELESFYNSKKQLFATPDTRDIYLLLTSSKAKADQAAAALKSGQSWNAVYKRYNDNKLWNSKSPLLNNVTPQSWLPELRKPIFAAPVGQVYGPVSVKPLKAYAVIEVKKARAGKAAPAYSSIKNQVEQAYLADRAAKSGTSAIEDLQQRWQPETDCSADYKKWYPCKGVDNPAGTAGAKVNSN